MNIKEFIAWVDSAKKGDSVVYFTGCNVPTEDDSKISDAYKTVREVCIAARKAYEKQLVILVQRRKSGGSQPSFEYIAQRTAQPVITPIVKTPAKAPAKAVA